MARELVQVEAEQRANGVIIPKTIIWKDGRRFHIRKTVFFSSSFVGEYEGIRYTVMIGREEKYLYRVKEKWYVNTETGGDNGEETHFV